MVPNLCHDSNEEERMPPVSPVPLMKDGWLYVMTICADVTNDVTLS